MLRGQIEELVEAPREAVAPKARPGSIGGGDPKEVSGIDPLLCIRSKKESRQGIH